MRRDSELASPEPIDAGSFSCEVGLDNAAASQAAGTLGLLSQDLLAACRAHFPPSEQYEHRHERDSGVVQGRRFVVTRRGFRVVVSLQWYARGHSYRYDETAGLAIRVTGQSRLMPRWVEPRGAVLHEATPLRAVGVVASALLGAAGLFGLQLVVQHPSAFMFLDVLGVAGAVMALGLCGLVLRHAVPGPWLLPSSRRLVAPELRAHHADLERWRALAHALSTVLPRALAPSVDQPQPTTPSPNP